MVKTPEPKEVWSLAYEIGALFLNYGGFEHTVSVAVAAVMELSTKQERSLVRGMQPRAKLEFLSSFAKKHWTKPAREALAPLIKRGLKLTDFRNDIAHGAMMHDKDGSFHIITFRGDDRFEGKAEPLSAEIVAPYVREAGELSDQFQHLAESVKAERASRHPARPSEHHPK